MTDLADLLQKTSRTFRRAVLRERRGVAAGGRLGQRASTARLIARFALRSRGARLLPSVTRETPRAATGAGSRSKSEGR
jgi:hypothetical protein